MCKSTKLKSYCDCPKCKMILCGIKWSLLVIAILIICFVVAVIVVEPIIFNGIFGWKPFESNFTPNEWFAFSASYIGAIGSVFVGIVALYQSKKYKKQADDYSEKMNNLLLLSELYPISIEKSNDHKVSNYAYFKIYGVDDKLGEYQDYRIVFTVIKNPVINFKLVSFKADYYIKDTIYSRYDRAENANKGPYDINDLSSYIPVDTCFAIGLGLPKVNANYQPNGQKPDVIKVYLELEYDNQYGMTCKKQMQLELNEEWSRKTTDRGAYPTWHIGQAKLIVGGTDNE